MTELTIFNQFLNLEPENISTNLNSFLNSNISISGISDFNIEKVLNYAIPDIQIKSLEIHEKSNIFSVNLKIFSSFHFDIRLAEKYINKYFKVSLKRYNFKDLNIVNILKDFQLDKLTENKKYIKDFKNSNVVQIGNSFDYNIEFSDEFIKDDYTFYEIQQYFDFEQFSKDYNIENVNILEKNNGKIILLQIFNNKTLETSTFSHFSKFGNNWQGPINVDSTGKIFSYSQKYLDSFEVFLLEKNISNITKIFNDNITTIEFFKDSQVQTVKDLKGVNVPRINVHDFGAISSPIQVIFDVDFLGILKDFSGYKDLLDKSPEIKNKCYISSIKVYRKRVDIQDTQNVFLGDASQQTSNIVNFENSNISLKEVKFELLESNQQLKSFILLDKTFENSKIEGKYQYSLIFEIINKIPEFINENIQKLQNVQKDLKNLNFVMSQNIDQFGNFEGTRRDFNEESYLNCLKTFSDSLGLVKNLNPNDIQNIYNISNVYDGNIKGVLKFSNDVKTLTDFYQNMNLDKEVSTLFKKSKTLKNKITYEFKFDKIFSSNKDGISFIDPQLIRENEVKNSNIIKLKPDNIVKFENVEPFKIQISENIEENLLNREDSDYIINSKNLKVQNFVDNSQKKDVISNLRDSFSNKSLSINLKIENDLGGFSSDKVQIPNVEFKNEEFRQLSENTIFDENLNNLNILKVFEKLENSNDKLETANIEYFSGYKTSENGEILMKFPIWKRYNKNVENFSILCRFQSSEDRLKTLNKYFVLNDFKDSNENLNYESVSNEFIQRMNNSKKLEYFKGFER